MTLFWQDARYAIRVMGKNLGFTAVAALTLALGVGANTAVFSLVRGVLLRTLPYPQPDRLVYVGRQMTHGDVTRTELAFWKEHSITLASMAGTEGRKDNHLAGPNGTEWVHVLAVSTDFFRTLRVAPSRGREFEAVETRPRGPQSLLLTEELRRRTFGAETNVVGRSVTFADSTWTVIGIVPRGFWYPEPADVFVPLVNTGGPNDNGQNTTMIARLKPGGTITQAGAEMDSLSHSFAAGHPDFLKYPGLAMMPYHDWLVGDVRLKLLLLFGAVGLLLLIACANLASLLMARLEARQREIAVRLALGSGIGRLSRQFLAENLLLAAIGSLIGFAGASLSLDSLVSMIPFPLPLTAPVRVDFAVLGFTTAVAFTTAILFSLAPVIMSARVDVQESLKGTGRTAGGNMRQRVRSVLVVSEVALSVTLLAGAALLAQSLYRLHQENLGFSPRGILTFSTPPAQRYRQGPEYWQFETSVLEKLRSLPGVRGVAAINILPLTSQSNYPTQQEGHPEHSIGGMEVRQVSYGYFETMGIPVRLGRSINERDSETAPPVVVVNEAVARKWWPESNPLGDHVLFGWFNGKNAMESTVPPLEVVGVAGDTKSVYLKSPPRPTIYLAAAQSPWYADGTSWVVRSDSPEALAGRLRAAIAEVNPRQSVERIRPMEDIVNTTMADSRFDTWIFGCFAGLALLLSAIGVYGLLSFSVARRTNEIGTRLALGATRSNVLLLVLRQGAGLIAAGLAVGLAGAFLLTRSLESLLFGVKPTDAGSFVVVAVVMLAAGSLASYLPARRATKIEPMAALRYE